MDDDLARVRFPWPSQSDPQPLLDVAQRQRTAGAPERVEHDQFRAAYCEAMIFNGARSRRDDRFQPADFFARLSKLPDALVRFQHCPVVHETITMPDPPVPPILD